MAQLSFEAIEITSQIQIVIARFARIFVPAMMLVVRQRPKTHIPAITVIVEGRRRPMLEMANMVADASVIRTWLKIQVNI